MIKNQIGRITRELNNLPIRSGDIFFRKSNAMAPCRIPFSKLVAYLTDSKYSHASMAYVENNEIFMVEVDEYGLQKRRLDRWLRDCHSDDLEVFRYKNLTEYTEHRLHQEAQILILANPKFDFTFDNENAYYCVESVVQMYINAGIKLIEPSLIKDIVKKWQYFIIKPINGFLRILTRKGANMKVPVYFVGNENKGLMSSRFIKQIYKFKP